MHSLLQPFLHCLFPSFVVIDTVIDSLAFLLPVGWASGQSWFMCSSSPLTHEGVDTCTPGFESPIYKASAPTWQGGCRAAVGSAHLQPCWVLPAPTPCWTGGSLSTGMLCHVSWVPLDPQSRMHVMGKHWEWRAPLWSVHMWCTSKQRGLHFGLAILWAGFSTHA